MIIGLSPCPHHASGNVGDQLLVEVTMDLINEIHGTQEFDLYFKREDLTSRLNHVNDADAILLFGFEIDEQKTRPEQYRIAEDLNDVEPPIIPVASSYRFFPGDEAELQRQSFGPQTRSFIDELVPQCPKGEVPVRDELVRRVLEQEGYDTVLTGDPAWYDLAMLGEPFHRPTSIDQIVFTTPHSSQYLHQAKNLVKQITDEYPDTRRVVSLHSAPQDKDRELCTTAEQSGWEIHYASHDPENLAMYRESDLHIGYRYHGHLAHLRWRRPSILLSEDSRGRGLTQSLGGAGVPAFESEYSTRMGGLPRRVADTTVSELGHALANRLGYTDALALYSPLKGRPNPDAVDEVLSMVQRQRAEGWPVLRAIRQTIDETYHDGMQPFLKNTPV